jgi:hypothetical protein
MNVVCSASQVGPKCNEVALKCLEYSKPHSHYNFTTMDKLLNLDVVLDRLACHHSLNEKDQLFFKFEMAYNSPVFRAEKRYPEAASDTLAFETGMTIVPELRLLHTGVGRGFDLTLSLCTQRLDGLLNDWLTEIIGQVQFHIEANGDVGFIGLMNAQPLGVNVAQHFRFQFQKEAAHYELIIHLKMDNS